MDISFQCEKCGQHLAIEEAGAGTEVQCPNCQSALTVPAPQPSERANPPQMQEQPVVDGEGHQVEVSAPRYDEDYAEVGDDVGHEAEASPPVATRDPVVTPSNTKPGQAIQKSGLFGKLEGWRNQRRERRVKEARVKEVAARGQWASELVVRGADKIKNGDHVGGITDLKLVADMGDDPAGERGWVARAKAQWLLGQIKASNGDYSGAIADLSRAISGDVTVPGYLNRDKSGLLGFEFEQALLLRARAKFKIGDLQGARQDLLIILDSEHLPHSRSEGPAGFEIRQGALDDLKELDKADAASPRTSIARASGENAEKRKLPGLKRPPVDQTTSSERKPHVSSSDETCAICATPLPDMLSTGAVVIGSGWGFCKSCSKLFCPRCTLKIESRIFGMVLYECPNCKQQLENP